MQKLEMELKIKKEFKDRETFMKSLVKDFNKVDGKEIAVNAFLACRSSVVVKIYTEQLLDREMSWKTFKEYMLSNINNMNIVTIVSVLVDESIKEN